MIPFSTQRCQSSLKTRLLNRIFHLIHFLLKIRELCSQVLGMLREVFIALLVVGLAVVIQIVQPRRIDQPQRIVERVRVSVPRLWLPRSSTV